MGIVAKSAKAPSTTSHGLTGVLYTPYGLILQPVQVVSAWFERNWVSDCALKRSPPRLEDGQFDQGLENRRTGSGITPR